MPNWIPITKETLYEAKIAVLIDACDTAALAEEQDPRSAGIIQGVVDAVRRKVGSCASNQVDADETTIPKGLRDLAVDMIIARLKGAIEEPLTEDEKTNLSNCLRDLNRIAECLDKVEQPDVAVEAPVQGGPGVTLIKPKCSRHPFSKLGTS